MARRYRGKDVVKWLDKMKYYDNPVEKHPLSAGVRDKTNHYVTERDGGRDIDLRKLALEGMQLYGRFEDVEAGAVRFGSDLRKNLDRADAAFESIKNGIDRFIADNGIDAPYDDRYTPLWEPTADAESCLDLNRGKVTDIGWCIGFKRDFTSVKEPIVDPRGYPGHERGVTQAPGLYFLGLPWQHTWGSGRFSSDGSEATLSATRCRLPTSTPLLWRPARVFG